MRHLPGSKEMFGRTAMDKQRLVCEKKREWRQQQTFENRKRPVNKLPFRVTKRILFAFKCVFISVIKQIVKEKEGEISKQKSSCLFRLFIFLSTIRIRTKLGKEKQLI